MWREGVEPLLTGFTQQRRSEKTQSGALLLLGFLESSSPSTILQREKVLIDGLETAQKLNLNVVVQCLALFRLSNTLHIAVNILVETM